MLLVSITTLLPYALATTFIGCFTSLHHGAEYPLLPGDHRSECYDTCQGYDIVGNQVLYSGVKENPSYEPAECYCTGYFPGSNRLTDCTDEAWNTVIDSSWYTWGCEPKSAGLTPSPQGQYATPSECFDTCSNMGPTEWTVMYSNGANGYYCWCTDGDGIPGGLNPRGCHSGSYFMYTKND